MDYGFGLLAGVFGFSIGFLLGSMGSQIFDDLKEKYKIKVSPTTKYEQHGISQYGDCLRYKLPEFEICATIFTKISDMNEKQVEKTMDKLQKWAEQETEKRIKTNIRQDIKNNI